MTGNRGSNTVQITGQAESFTEIKVQETNIKISGDSNSDVSVKNYKEAETISSNVQISEEGNSIPDPFIERQIHTVCWIVDDAVTEQRLEEGATIVKPADPVKEGYTFTGWSPAVPVTMPAKDMTFTAQFKKNETPPTGKVHSVTAKDISLLYKSGSTIQPAVTADSGVKYTITYSGFDSKVVSVDANGRVTALKKGTTNVTVTATDEYGNTAECTCKITVKYAWWQILIRIFLLGFIWY